MKTIVCPTVTSENSHQYREQMERASAFAKRIHIDFMDGVFSPTKSPTPEQAWWPEHMKADLHIMYQHPEKHLESIKRLKPNLVIVHAEAEGNFVVLARELHESGIKAGLALLADTPVSVIKPALEHIDHVLIFSGNLGHFGGTADLRLLEKVKECKTLKPRIEVGWDGGISDENVRELAKAGVNVLNVGGYIQHAEKPYERFSVLENLLH